MTNPGLVKSSRPSSQPCWNTSVSTPKATPTETRLRKVDSSATGTLRNAVPIITRVSRSTNPITPGIHARRRSSKSRLDAAAPPTAHSVPESANAAGARSSRRSLIAAALRSSDSGQGSDMVSVDVAPSAASTRPSGTVSKSPRPAADSSVASALRASSPRATTVTVVPSLGNSSATARRVSAAGMPRGSVSRLEACIVMPRAGTARTPTTATDAASAAAGWRTTGARTRRLIPPAPMRRLSRQSSGTRGRSTQRPSATSSAGSTVIDPTTATATTTIAPSARESKVTTSTRKRPAMDAATARPETRIEWPEVWAAISTASRVVRPRARSSRSRLR